MSPGETLELTVNLTKEQIEAGPHAREDDPVTTDMEAFLYDYCGWDPYWGATHFGDAHLPNAEAWIVGDAVRREPDAEIPPIDGVNRSVKGYYVHALDGDIGHVENLLADDTNWEIRS